MKNKFINSLFFLLLAVMGENCSKQETVNSVVAQDRSLADTAASAVIHKYDHIVIVFEENRSYSQVIGSADAPFINALANDSDAVLFSQSYGITHPSQPNYLQFYSGSDQGVLTDNRPLNIPFTTPNLGYQLIAAGYSFATYSQDLPYVGFNGDTTKGYVRRHNPAANWMGIGTNQISPFTNKPLSRFPADFTQLPTVSFIIPDVLHDMHDGSMQKGDKWLKYHFKPYIEWAKTNNSLFILTFDEDDRLDSNHITTIFCGYKIRHGVNNIPINHYRILRTIEDMYGLPYAGNAANVKPISNCWK